MKKLFVILVMALSVFAVACGSSESTEAATVDSTATVIDSAAGAIADSAKATIDSAASAITDSAKAKLDSLKK